MLYYCSKDLIVINPTRVNARWIRKYCKIYHININESLRSAVTRAKYVALIADEIIKELGRKAMKESNQSFLQQIESALPKGYATINYDSFFSRLDIYYIAEKKIIGSVSKSLLTGGHTYRFSTDSKLVARPAQTLLQAVNVVLDNHARQLKASIM
jgi:hypothetical protein